MLKGVRQQRPSPLQDAMLSPRQSMSRPSGAHANTKATREFLTAHAILNSPRGRGRPTTAAVPTQDNLVKQELHNQMVRMRDAFIRVDPRLEGAISRHMVGCTLKAGGMELTPGQLKDALYKYVTGDGKFNWKTFCEDVEKARMQSWSEATRVKHASLFQAIDKDGSGRLGRDELSMAVKRMGLHVKADELDNLFNSMDEDRDGNLDLPEFIDGLATNMVMPTHVFTSVVSSHQGPYKLGGVKFQQPALSPR